MPAGQTALLLVVDGNSHVVSSAVHDYSHLFRTSTRFTAMIQLKPGIPPASLNESSKLAERQKNRAGKKKNTGLRFKRVSRNATFPPFNKSNGNGAQRRSMMIVARLSSS